MIRIFCIPGLDQDACDKLENEKFFSNDKAIKILAHPVTMIELEYMPTNYAFTAGLKINIPILEKKLVNIYKELEDTFEKNTPQEEYYDVVVSFDVGIVELNSTESEE